MSTQQNPIVPVDSIPQYLQKYRTDEKDYRGDIGHLSPRDIRAPFLKIVHGNSDFLKPGWGPRGNEQPLQYGAMLLTHNYTILPQGTNIIPLARDVCFIEWKDGKPGTQLLHFSRNPNEQKVIDGTAFRTDPNTGQSIKPTMDTYINIYFVSEYNQDQPVILSFYRTGLKSGRKFTNLIMQATDALKIPMHCHKYSVSAIEAPPDSQGNRWCEFSLSPNGFTDEALIPLAEKMRERALFLIQASSTAEFAQEVASATGEMVQAEGTVVNDTPAAAAAPPAASAPAAAAPPAASAPAAAAPTQPTQPAQPAQPTAAQPAQSAPVQPVQHTVIEPPPPQQPPQQPPQPQTPSAPPQTSKW